MATEIKMPQLSDTMQSGKILRWNKKEGDSVKRGDALAEVETEKANLDIEAFVEGVILKILVREDGTAKVGETIALIGTAGEEVTDTAAPAAQQVSSATPADEEPSPAPSSPALSTTHEERVKASPLARRLAEESHINLSSVKGTGPEGRILRRDIEHAQGAVPPPVAPAAVHPTPSQPAVGGFAGQLSAPSKMRETIAARMQQSVTESPHFYVTVAIDMSEAVLLQQRLKQEAAFEGISINHLVIKAAAYALERETKVNSSMREGRVFEPDGIHIGIVTVLEDGLLVPVIRDANKLSLKDLVFEARAAVERARAGRPTTADLTGGTFSVSNMGMFDVENFTAIINPGQGAILAVSSARDEAIVERGQVVVRKMMRVTLSSDHRVIDGVAAARFLGHLKEALQMPALLFI